MRLKCTTKSIATRRKEKSLQFQLSLLQHQKHKQEKKLDELDQTKF